MNKEQVAFLVVVALLLLLYLTGGEEPASRRAFRRPSTEPLPEAQELATPAWLEEGRSAWSAIGRNPYQAPRETENLPRLDLLPPPLPALPHPGLPLVPPVGGMLAARLRHELRPDPSISLPPPGAAGGSTIEFTASEPPPEGGDNLVEDDLVMVDASSVGMTLAEKLRLSTEEKLRRQRLEAEARLAEVERRRRLDSVVWTSGDVSYGALEPLQRGADVYRQKLRLDTIRADLSLGEEERRRQLEEVKLVFREDRGPGKPASRTVISGASIQKMEFANTPLNRFHLRKLVAPADSRTEQEDLARLVFEAGELKVAASHLEEMVARGMESPRTFAMLADSYRRAFRYDRELGALQRGLQSFGQDVGLLARLGQLCIRLRLSDRAEEAFRQALGSDPGDALAHLGLGSALLEKGRVDEALAHLRQAETGTGLDREQQLETLLRVGEAWARKGNATAAANAFDRVLDQDPTNPRALSGNAVLALASSGAEAARGFIDRGREAHPLDGTLAYLDAVCLFRLQRFVEGRDALLLAMELDPLLTSRARAAMSYLLEKVGENEAALSEAEQAVRADPLDLEARLQRARALLNVGDLNAAREEYLRVLEGSPDRVDVLVALGDASFRSGNQLEAARYYARAEEADPSFPDLLARRLICEVRRRREQEAEELMKRIDPAQERDPIIQLGQAYYHYAIKGTTEEAVRKLQVLLERKQGDAELQAYASQTLALVEENQNKEIWRDAFNRSGGQILKGWRREIGSGVQIALSGGRILFEGIQRNLSHEPTVLIQERPGRLVQSFSVDLDMQPQPGAYMGIGMLAFNRSPREPDPWPGLQRREGRSFAFLGVQIVLAPEGKLVYRTITQGSASEWTELPQTEYSGGPATLGLELVDARRSLYRLLLNQRPLLAELEIPGLSRRPGSVELQIFCQAAIDRPVRFFADNVSLVTYKK